MFCNYAIKNNLWERFMWKEAEKSSWNKKQKLHSAQCIAAGWTAGWLNTWHDTVQKKSNIRGKWRKKKASKNLKNFNIKNRLQYLVTYLASILSLCAWIFCVPDCRILSVSEHLIKYCSRIVEVKTLLSHLIMTFFYFR